MVDTLSSWREGMRWLLRSLVIMVFVWILLNLFRGFFVPFFRKSIQNTGYCSANWVSCLIRCYCTTCESVKAYFISQLAGSFNSFTQWTSWRLTLKHMAGKSILCCMDNEGSLLHIGSNSQERQEPESTLHWLVTVKELYWQGDRRYWHCHRLPTVSADTANNFFNGSIYCVHTTRIRHLNTTKVQSCDNVNRFFCGGIKHLQRRGRGHQELILNVEVLVLISPTGLCREKLFWQCSGWLSQTSFNEDFLADISQCICNDFRW